MYNVIVTNNYQLAVFVDDNDQKLGPNPIFPHWGTHRLNIQGMGDLTFFDLGDHKLEKYTNKDLPWTLCTWGGLIRYRGMEAYFRYEGQGEVHVDIQAWGIVKLHFPQGGMIIRQDDLVVV